MLLRTLLILSSYLFPSFLSILFISLIHIFFFSLHSASLLLFSLICNCFSPFLPSYYINFSISFLLFPTSFSILPSLSSPVHNGFLSSSYAFLSSALFSCFSRFLLFISSFPVFPIQFLFSSCLSSLSQSLTVSFHFLISPFRFLLFSFYPLHLSLSLLSRLVSFSCLSPVQSVFPSILPYPQLSFPLFPFLYYSFIPFPCLPFSLPSMSFPVNAISLPSLLPPSSSPIRNCSIL